ncbi:hypothetical protein Dimus_013032 [Dionaea muscipula]
MMGLCLCFACCGLVWTRLELWGCWFVVYGLGWRWSGSSPAFLTVAGRDGVFWVEAELLCWCWIVSIDRGACCDGVLPGSLEGAWSIGLPAVVL